MVEFDQYDKLKYELFEQLLPVLLYEEKDDVEDESSKKSTGSGNDR